MHKWKALRGCVECHGTGYWVNCFGVQYRCECYKRTKAWKNRKILKPKYNYINQLVYSYDPTATGRYSLRASKLFEEWWSRNFSKGTYSATLKVKSICRDAWIKGWESKGEGT